MVFQFLLQSFCSKSIVDMLTEVDHVTNYLKERSIDRLIDNRNNSPFESKAMGFKMFCKIPLTKSKASKTEMFIL